MSTEDYKTQLLEQQKLITQLLQIQQQQLTLSGNAPSSPTVPALPTVPQVTIPPPSEFSFQAEDWEDWKVRFLRYKRIALANLKSNQHVDYLIGHLGTKAENILKSFKLSDTEMENFDFVLGKFDSYYNLKKNLVFERVKFLQRTQSSDEPCDSFLTDLTTMAQTCEWGTLESEMIKLRIIAGLADSRMSVQLQSRPDDTLEEVIRRVRLAETLKKQQVVIRSSAPAPANYSNVRVEGVAAEINFVKKGAKPKYPQKHNQTSSSIRSDSNHAKCDSDNEQQEKQCRKCGLAPRHPFVSCPARNDKCRKCDKKGHWSVRCVARASIGNNKRRQSENNKVESIEVSNSDFQSISSVGDEEIFFLGSVDSERSEPWKVTVNVSGVPIPFKIDTGADVTVIKSSTLPCLEHFEITAPQRPLLSASGDKINIKGVIRAKMTWKNHSCENEIYVADNLHANLLGRDAVQSLGILSWCDVLSVQEEFPSLFHGIGDLGKTYKICLKAETKPFSIFAPRRVPLHLKAKVKENLDLLEKSGVIFKVTEPTPWCAPMVVVPKKDNKVRVCVDYTNLNKNVLTEKLVLPDITESLAEIGPDARVFSKLDATAGFYHVPLDSESRLMTTFITPFGRYAFKKLPMGITSAPERFQREMTEALEGLEGIVNVADDTLVFGSSKEEHDKRLREVLKRCQEKGIKLNKDKCVFGVPKLTFLGHVISHRGVEIDRKKLCAILEMPAPKDISGVRQLLGCVQVHAKFLPSLADMASPIHQLLREKNDFVWSSNQQEAFEKIKKALTSAPILAHFAPGRPTRVAADASSYGLGAILEQQQPDNSWRVVYYASRTMSDAEKRYVQIEREALASTWACEKFKQFLIGAKFTILTDHKPLVELLGSKPIADLSARIQRFRMRLMQFSYDVVYIPGKQMITADMLSRAPVKSSDPGTDALLIESVELFVDHIIKSTPISDSRLAQVGENQKLDIQSCRLFKYIQEGWPMSKELPVEDKIFYQYQGDLAILNGLITFCNRVYIPPTLRPEMLDSIHEGHLGITKCRSRAKETIWWPKINAHIETKIMNCDKCIEFRTPPVEHLKPSTVPDYPWQIIAVDLCDVRGKSYLIAVDYFSRYIEVASLNSQTAKEVIAKLIPFMARWGIPETLRSDNGPCFDSHLFKEFRNKYGFNHITSSPLYPKSNGQVEAAVKTAKKILLKSDDPNLGLLSYRTSKLECGFSPSQLIMGRNPRTTLPTCKANLIPTWTYIGEYKKKRNIEIQKYSVNYNRGHRTRSVSPLKTNDRVWITNVKKFGTVVNENLEPRSYTVIADNTPYRRNRSHLIKAAKILNTEFYTNNSDFEDDFGRSYRETTNHKTVMPEERREEIVERVPENSENLENTVETSSESNHHAQEDVEENVSQYYTTRSGRRVKPPNKYGCCSECKH